MNFNLRQLSVLQIF